MLSTSRSLKATELAWTTATSSWAGIGDRLDSDGAVAPGALGRVERGVRAVHERGRGLVAVRLHDTGRARDAGGEGCAQALDDEHRAGQVAVGQPEGALLAAVAREHVAGPQLLAPGRGRGLEHAVAGLVAVDVV